MQVVSISRFILVLKKWVESPVYCWEQDKCSIWMNSNVWNLPGDLNNLLFESNYAVDLGSGLINQHYRNSALHTRGPSMTTLPVTTSGPWYILRSQLSLSRKFSPRKGWPRTKQKPRTWNALRSRNYLKNRRPNPKLTSVRRRRGPVPHPPSRPRWFKRFWRNRRLHLRRCRGDSEPTLFVMFWCNFMLANKFQLTNPR